MTIEVAGSRRASELLRRPWVAALVVLAVYGVLALLNSTGGYLGTDTGAKVITLDRMAEESTFSPAIGYWAEEWDPGGTYHPLLDTAQNSDGEWVNVTTLPMLIAARPLYEVGGYRLALLLPMLGAVLAAFAARDVVRQLGNDRAAWSAFWLVALASPITIYALDFWEHSIGAGLMLLAFALLLRVVRAQGHWLLAGLAGVALGTSATMRTESLVVAAVFVGGSAAVLLLRWKLWHAVRLGGSAVAGFAVPWLLNAELEAVLGGSSRASRASTAAAGAGSGLGPGSDEVATRLKEALVTWFAIPGLQYPGSVVVGAVTVGSIVMAAHLSRRGHAKGVRWALAVSAAGYVLVAASGFGFVPGALVAAPVAALAFAAGRWSGDRAALVAIAIAATVLIWSFQFTGGAGPQWGGRYILVPTVLLLSLGVVVAHASGRVLLGSVFALSAIVTIFGIVWLHERSHGVAAFFDDLAAQAEDVVVSANGFLVREAGPAYDDRRYLSVGRNGDVEGAIEVVRRAGFDSVGVLTSRPDPGLVDESHLESQQVDFLGVSLWYHTFELR